MAGIDPQTAEDIMALLSPTQPTSEGYLYELLRDGNGMSREDAARYLNWLQAENHIRWVAFEGWCLGGRPS